MFRALIVLIVCAALVAAALFFVAGRSTPPSLSIDKPDRVIGQSGELEVTAGAPGARLTSLTVSLEQNGRVLRLFALDNPQSASVSHPDPDHVRIARAIGKQSVPDLQQGSARIRVAASRKSFLNLRTFSSEASRDIRVRLDPPRLSVLSTHHYVNHGGSEMVLYRATPPDVLSGVRVGDIEYPGYVAAGAGAPDVDPAVKVAFFALLHEQEMTTPIALFARDEAGNETKASFVDNVFAKPFKHSRIEVDDRYFERVVPEILQHSPELGATATGDLLSKFLKVNGELRRLNAERIIAIARNTSPSRLWEGPFVQLGNSQVEASFADRRTYIYQGKEVDQQVHLGFDLAVTANVPVIAANAGKVLHAAWLGIYGNCIIVDHGMGVASLYGHLSSFDVRAGDTVKKGQTLGRSGMTGLAGGDHLHFTVLANGRPVNPVEWWDAHWIEDRVTRKLNEVGAESSTVH